MGTGLDRCGAGTFSGAGQLDVQRYGPGRSAPRAPGCSPLDVAVTVVRTFAGSGGAARVRRIGERSEQCRTRGMAASA